MRRLASRDPNIAPNGIAPVSIGNVDVLSMAGP